MRLYRRAGGFRVRIHPRPSIAESEVNMQSALERLRAEFLEMPGLRLTPQQVHRLCGLEQATCREVLDVLVSENFLCARPDGTYTRLTDGEFWRPRQMKAELDQPDLRRQAS
jgi:hypothetical protein